MSREDFRDIENLQPFILTTQDLTKYNVTYKGRQVIDELQTYVFAVSPRQLERNERYFEGTIWVEENDLQIVKTLRQERSRLQASKAGWRISPQSSRHFANGSTVSIGSPLSPGQTTICNSGPAMFESVSQSATPTTSSSAQRPGSFHRPPHRKQQARQKRSLRSINAEALETQRPAKSQIAGLPLLPDSSTALILARLLPCCCCRSCCARVVGGTSPLIR